MSDFRNFSMAVHKQLEKMVKYPLFKTDVAKDDMYAIYLSSFPDGSNPIFKERTEHDCNTCKSFIKACGNVIAIIDDKRVSPWDFDDIGVDECYRVVAASLSEFVKNAPITNIFLHDQSKVGQEENHQLLENGSVRKWHHLHFDLPAALVNTTNRGSVLSEAQTNAKVLERSLLELTKESLEVVEDLIYQNSLYRGEEHIAAVQSFKNIYENFYKKDDKDKSDFIWLTSRAIGGLSKFRNSVIGTLVVDISNGVSLDTAVRSFETKVAPQNYKRTSSVVTKGMIEQAQKKVEELGIKESLSRRYAHKDDITVNNILFVYRPTEAKKELDVFDLMKKEAKVKNKFDKVEEIPIEKFLKDVLPKAEQIEVMVENKHQTNLMSLVAPVDPKAKNIFKWDNNFSWSYNGDVTDSIKERVKKAGGIVDAVLRCSLSWFNYDDLDIHVREPGGNLIYFSSKMNPRTSGQLDVDMNAGAGKTREAVENIVWTRKDKMLEGEYELIVHNYCKRESKDVGFEVEMEYEGTKYFFNYEKAVRHNQKVTVAKFKFSRESGVKIIESLPHNETSKDLWGVQTNKFQKVSMIMNSPNHWDGNATGNKHWFFILEGCKNPASIRGFYNEFLNNELMPHRKVFEVLGAKLKAEYSEHQLSGVGFSSTQRNSLLCKVSGSFSRMVRINF